MRFKFDARDFERTVRRQAAQFKRDRRRAARVAVDAATKKTQRAVQSRMRSVGLGRLAGGVGQTSSLKKGVHPRNEWGVVYARGKGQTDSRTAGAIEAYSEGVTIRAKRGTWLAFSTSALPRTTGRKRMTPLRYQTTGWQQRLGPLEFRPISRNLALLVIRNVTMHPKTGRARRAGPGKTRTRIAAKETVAFILIRQTVRGKRFDQRTIAGVYARKLPEFIGLALAEIRRQRG